MITCTFHVYDPECDCAQCVQTKGLLNPDPATIRVITKDCKTGELTDHGTLEDMGFKVVDFTIIPNDNQNQNQ